MPKHTVEDIVNRFNELGWKCRFIASEYPDLEDDEIKFETHDLEGVDELTIQVCTQLRDCCFIVKTIEGQMHFSSPQSLLSAKMYLLHSPNVKRKSACKPA